MKYHFLKASTTYYKDNSFKELLDEENKYDNTIFWNIKNHMIKIDDICLIYYSNLPDYSSRILFYGKVLNIVRDKGQNYAQLKIKSISLEDNKKFNKESLINNYNLNPTCRNNYLHIYNDIHKGLINDIKPYLNKGSHLKAVYEYFDKNYCMCEFGCKTFVQENGFHYIEKHHLVQRNLIKRNIDIKDIDKLIDDDKNKYYLCPNCHMKIHHIKINDRKKMIEKLYNKNKKFYDNNFNELKGNKKTLEWLYSIYQCDKQ